MIIIFPFKNACHALRAPLQAAKARARALCGGDTAEKTTG